MDIGVNLTHYSFQKDREELIARALHEGVKTMIVTGACLRSSQEAYALAKSHSGILYATAGVHPHDAKHCNETTLTSLENLAQHKEVVALGECGLDYNRNFSPHDVQEHWFEAQVNLACHLKMPLFLHEREASRRLLEILQKYSLPPTVIHCFTGSEEEVKKYLSLGFYIGITGWICDDRRGMHLRKLLKYIPLDHLMLETDAPYLTPRNMPYRPKEGRNESAFLPYVLKMVALTLGQPEEEIARKTTENAKTFFRLPI